MCTPLILSRAPITVELSPHPHMYRTKHARAEVEEFARTRAASFAVTAEAKAMARSRAAGLAVPQTNSLSVPGEGIGGRSGSHVGPRRDKVPQETRRRTATHTGGAVPSASDTIEFRGTVGPVRVVVTNPAHEVPDDSSS
jgi:hypothetical protein